jgi:hypothetical protein
MDIIRNPHKAEAYIREEASWRRMLVQQPPANGLALLQVHTRDVDHPFEGSRYKVLVRLRPFVELTRTSTPGTGKLTRNPWKSQMRKSRTSI